MTRCVATTLSGSQCSRPAGDDGTCWQHAPTLTDTAWLIAQADRCRRTGEELYVPPERTLTIAEPVDLVGVRFIVCKGLIVCEGEGALVAGFQSHNPAPCNFYFADIKGKLRLVGIKNGIVTVQRCDHVELFADGNEPLINSMGYSAFHWGQIHKLEIRGVGTGWVNENLHHGGRFREIWIGDNRRHNHNVFLKPCAESGSIKIVDGSRNVMQWMRTEGDTTIELGEPTWANELVDLYARNPGNLTPPAKVIDKGQHNVYVGSHEVSRRAKD